jgi:uncharacterized protein (TIGR02145 family)
MPTGTKWYIENDPCPEGWRVPTNNELNLLQEAGSEWTTRNGVNGCFFGTGENRIFLPASGWRHGITSALNLVGTHNTFWSSTEGDSNSARSLSFDSGYVYIGNYSWRNAGASVRCVAIK